VLRSSAGPPLSPGALAVTRRLLIHGPQTRGHLGEHLSLSETSISRATRSLVKHGMVVEELLPPSATGRPPRLLSPVPGARHVVGVKLTGDTAYGVVCNLLGEVVHTGRSKLPPAADGVVPVARTVALVNRLVQRLARRVPTLDAVSVSLGGVVDDRSIVREGTFLGWRDVDLATQLTAATNVPVSVTNDVTALAREQLWFGAGRTHSTFGLVTVGAGLGFGVVREGHVVERLIDNGDLLGHAPVDTAGPPCPWGHRGCVAAYLYREVIEARESAAAGRPVTLPELMALDRTAPWFLGAARALGHLVATFAGALQTERIVLAGEDVTALMQSEPFEDTLAERLRDGPGTTQRCTLDVSTEPLTFTDWARGAAVVGIQHLLSALPG